MKHIQILSGHSGCEIYLMREDKKIFVRKISASAAYNIRLKKQFIKQKRFHSQKVYVPETFSYGYESGKFYFDMAFINGITLAEHMKVIKTKDIVRLMTVLFDILPVHKNKRVSTSQKVFTEKINELKKKISRKSKNVSEALFILDHFDFSHIPQTYCCGDLTLENILIDQNEGKIVLIDFLDSFYNSWMIDLSKLLQDLELGWSWRNFPKDDNRDLRCMIARQILIENVSELPNGRRLLLEVYHILLLNVLRIYPYAQDDKTLEWLDNALQKTLSVIEHIKEKVL